MYDPASVVRGKDALDNYKGETLAAALADGAVLDAKYDRGELTVEVARPFIISVCESLKEEGYNFLEDVTAVDWYPSEPRFQITYHILSMTLKERVRLAVRLDGEDA